MASEDISLTFDSKPFLSAINQVGQSMTASVGQFSAWTVAEGQLVADMVKRSVGKIAGYMPEIGRSFGMAGDIITRNLFWPLRKEIVPLLQKMLDWVRDHRAMFVQWGNVLVNIFRAVKTIVMSFIDLLKNMWERLSSGLERIFGKTQNTVMQTVNLILFKLTVVFMLIMQLMQPVIDFIVDGFLKIIEYVKKFGEGFMSTVGDITPNIMDLGKSLDNLFGRTTNLSGAFGKLGEVLGVTVKPLLSGIASMIDGIALSIDGLIMAFNVLQGLKEGGFEGAKKAWEKGDAWQKSKERGDARWKDTWENTKSGVNTIFNGESNVAPIKPAGNNTNNSNSKVDNSTYNINVSGSKDPAKDATDIHKKVKEQATKKGH